MTSFIYDTLLIIFVSIQNTQQKQTLITKQNKTFYYTITIITINEPKQVLIASLNRVKLCIEIKLRKNSNVMNWIVNIQLLVLFELSLLSIISSFIPTNHKTSNHYRRGSSLFALTGKKKMCMLSFRIIFQYLVIILS